MMDELRMYTSEDLMEILNCSITNVNMLREMGIIPAIRTGRNYMFSREAIIRFQREYEGLDVSNRVYAKKAKEIVEARRAEAMPMSPEGTGREYLGG